MSKNLVVDIGRELFLEENLKKIAKTQFNKDNILEATAISAKYIVYSFPISFIFHIII